MSKSACLPHVIVRGFGFCCVSAVAERPSELNLTCTIRGRRTRTSFSKDIEYFVQGACCRSPRGREARGGEPSCVRERRAATIGGNVFRLSPRFRPKDVSSSFLSLSRRMLSLPAARRARRIG